MANKMNVVLVLALLGAPAWAQDSGAPMPGSHASGVQELTGGPRPVPPPQAGLALPPPLGSGVAKPPLAWRAKAFFLHNSGSPTPAGTPALRPTIQRSIVAQSNDALIAILASCPQFHIQVESVNSASGEVLAHWMNTEPGTPSRIVMVLQPSGTTKANFTATIEPDNENVRRSLDTLLTQVNASFTKKAAL